MHGAEIPIQISALARVEPQTFEFSGRERYHYTTEHPIVLVVSYDMREDSNPDPAGRQHPERMKIIVFDYSVGLHRPMIGLS